MRGISILSGFGLLLASAGAQAQSATPGPGLPDPANSPTAGDHYRGADGRQNRPSPGRRSATPPPGLPDPNNSPTAGQDRDDRRNRRNNRGDRFRGPVFGRPGDRRSDAPFAPQAEDAFPRSTPPPVYYGGQRTREKGDFAEPDFARDRREGR